MNTKLGFVKLTALAAMCAVGLCMTQFARADGISIGYQSGWHRHDHSRYSVSVGLGSGYYGGGYYAPRRYAPRYYAPAPVYYYPSDSYYYDGGPSYYDDDYPSYGYYERYPSYSFSYSNYGRGYDRDDYYRHRDYGGDGDRHWGGDRGGDHRDHDGDRHHH